MRSRFLCLAALVAFVLPVPAAHAATIPFVLDGNAGEGLLPGNENPAVTGGSGGILGGISYDTETFTLSIDIGWGSGNGFSDLTGNATAGHIHGSTADPDPTGFGQNAGVLVGLNNLPGWDGSATSGGFSGSLVLTQGQEDAVLGGLTYINIHTVANGGGEIRGHLVPVPEPGAAPLVVLGLAALAKWRRKRARLS